MRDHPRVCGEKCGPLRWGPEMPGSPPRMRGKGSGHALLALLIGITPAYAGKSQCRASLAHLHGDHPRVCGEKAQTAQQTETRKGSPPRMRGKVPKAARQLVRSGITPAYAGKSRTGSGPVPGPKDHPRVCGEKSTARPGGYIQAGSPPRMRGKVRL